MFLPRRPIQPLRRAPNQTGGWNIRAAAALSSFDTTGAKGLMHKIHTLTDN
jgi:hypothetical protein